MRSQAREAGFFMRSQAVKIFHATTGGPARVGPPIDLHDDENIY